MKQKLLLLLTALCFGFISGVKADVVVPNPVYFNDFSSSDGLTQVGSGEFIDDVDPRFGQIYHNNPGNITTPRTNYLKLPSDVLTHSGTTQEMTIGFWVNCKSTTEYFYCPLFSAYSTTEKGKDNGLPMFMCQSRCLLQINAGDGYWSDFVDAQNDNHADNATTTWLDDNKWHYYTVTLTSIKAIVYVDGVVQNSWTLDGTSEGQNISGFFTKAASGTYPEVCLGGNQAWGWSDKDPSYGFDDFAVYDAALTAEQIAQIISNKKESAEIIGETDFSTAYLGDKKSFSISQGEKKTLTFINHGQNTQNYFNWVLQIVGNNEGAGDDLKWRADNYVVDDDGSTYTTRDMPGFDWNWETFRNNLQNSEVTMTISYGANGILSLEAKDGPGKCYTHTLTYKDGNAFSGNVTLYLSVDHSWIEFLSEETTAVIGTIASSGYSSLATPYGLDFANATGLTAAYVVSEITKTAVRLTSVDELPANSGVILKGAPGATYSIPVKADATYDGTNKLHAAVTAYDCIANEVYILQSGLFHLVTEASTVPAGKAYLKAEDVHTEARTLIFCDEEDPTAINAVKATEAEAQKDGKYLENGKIVIVKNGIKYSANGQILK